MFDPGQQISGYLNGILLVCPSYAIAFSRTNRLEQSASPCRHRIKLST
jgi:hypothetical protein